MRVILLPHAREDLREIKEYIAKENPEVSRRVAERIKQALHVLSENPYIGNLKDDEGILERHLPGIPYTLPYRIINNDLQILRVFHESQNKPNKWEVS